MVQAIAGTIGGLFGNQTRREISRPQIQSVTPALMGQTDKKTQKQILKAAREERIYNLFMQPEVMGLVLTFAGVLAANKIPFSSNEAENNLLQGIMTTTSVVMGCGYAGVGDLTSLSLGISAGGASILSGLVGDVIDDAGGSLNPFKWKWPLGPIWNW